MKYFILFGPPGAGKGTQASAMAERYNLKHISTGELLRNEIASGTARGKKAEELIDSGNFVPDEMVEEMLADVFASHPHVDGFLLDGFPRTLSQAIDLDNILAENDEEVTAVISLMIPDETVHARIKHRATIEGRVDDASDEVISTRIKTYHAKTEPLISFYKPECKYHEVDGTGTIEQVRDKVFALMDKL